MELNKTNNLFQIDIHKSSINIMGKVYQEPIIISPQCDIATMPKDITEEFILNQIGIYTIDLILWGENDININKRSMLTNLCWQHNVGIDINTLQSTCETLKILFSEKRQVLTFINL